MKAENAAVIPTAKWKLLKIEKKRDNSDTSSPSFQETGLVASAQIKNGAQKDCTETETETKREAGEEWIEVTLTEEEAAATQCHKPNPTFLHP